MTFSPNVYERIREGCQRSAAAVVPYVWELVRPSSVLDVGGGEGWWARECVHAGTTRAVVLDESCPRVPEIRDGIEFAWFDAEKQAQWPSEDRFIEEKFDLAICLETVEHVDAETGDYLIDFLTKAAPVVLFSAAIPEQGGHGHVNEQWPIYWAERFHAHNFVATDIRDRFWDDERVESWYRQNLLIFASLDHDWAGTGATYGLAQLPTTTKPRSLVHPEIYAWRIDERNRAMGTA